jgi:hypothetical protein
MDFFRLEKITPNGTSICYLICNTCLIHTLYHQCIRDYYTQPPQQHTTTYHLPHPLLATRATTAMQLASMRQGCLQDQVAKAASSDKSHHGRMLLFEGMVQLECMEYKLLQHIECKFLDWDNYSNNRGNKIAARRSWPVFWNVLKSSRMSVKLM